jgi:23S rRNA (adenine2030-N6)-methyltransferase
MNYRHIYHAGNYADVVKHCVLILLIEMLKQKPKAFCILDTHAGVGLYDLQSEMSQKTAEYKSGINLLFNKIHAVDLNTIKNYLTIIQHYNVTDKLALYPGSPLFAINTLRDDDELIACELHPDDYSMLKKNLRKYKNAHTHHINGYNGIKAFLPPKHKRGLVLIDPPFEKQTEFDDIISAINLALKHWRNGIYCIWYPIKDSKKVNQFYRELTILPHELITVEFSIDNNDSQVGLSSFGLVVINPPWKTHDKLNVLLPYLAQTLNCSWKLTLSNNA